MIPALLAMAAVWLVAGWWSHSGSGRRSRRAARFWAAAALAALAGANAIAIQQAPGPWWPLLERPWSAGDWTAVLLWIAALVLVFRARQPGRVLGLALMAGAAGVFAVGLIVSSSGRASHAGGLCLGQSGPIGPWSAQLRGLEPIAGHDYTGIAATLNLRSGIAQASQARPQHRDYIAGAGAGSGHAGADIVQRLNGELLVKIRALPANPECIAVQLEWRPFAQWLRYGAWLSLAGASLLLAAAVRSAWWRAAAWDRIAMRRADRRARALPVSYRALAWQPLAIATVAVIMAFAWQWGQHPQHGPSARPAVNGPAMIAARQSLFGGPRLDNRWIVTADALARHGQFGDAAGMLLGATGKEPGNAEAWLAMGDALYGHAGGQMTAAAQLAYHRADRASSPQGAPPSLVTEALLRSGRGALARSRQLQQQSAP